MILLSALVALLTAGMAATHVANPEAVPLYVVASGVAMTAVTFLSARIFVFLRMFVVGYAVAFAAFAAGFIVFGTSGLPDWAPGWVQTHAAQAVPRARLHHPRGGDRADRAPAADRRDRRAVRALLHQPRPEPASATSASSR